METPDDPEFEDFVMGALNASFSTTFNDSMMDSDQDDLIINNIIESDVSDDDESNNQPTTDISVQPTADRPIVDISRPGPSHRATPVIPTMQPITSPTIQSFSHITVNQPTLTPVTQVSQSASGSISRIWKNVTDNDPGPNHTIPIYTVASGPVLPENFDANTKPIEYFDLFLNEDIISHICTETNIYSNNKKTRILSPHSRIRKWKDITPIDLRAFFGTVINMGLIPLSSIESYFTTAWEGRIPFFRDVFTKDEFLNIFWNLHFNHTTDGNRVNPKGFLVAPMLSHMRRCCKLFYNPSNRVSIDESTISFKGNVSFRVYNPMKPVKFGLKIFVLSDSVNGYMYDFIPYYGSGTCVIPNSNLLKTTQIVKMLAESVVMKDSTSPATGLHIYTDRYYTSPQLSGELLSMGCYLTGTVMTNRTGMPPGLKKIGKKMKKGDLLSQRLGPTLVTTWKDKRAVHMLSTYSKGSRDLMTNVPNKWPNKPPTPKPHVVLDYIKNMGGVDRSDHFVSSYQFIRRTKKWYRKTFFWLFEVGIINSYLLYKQIQEKHNSKPLTHKAFRHELVKSLVGEKVASRPIARKRGRPAQGPLDERLNGRHFLSRQLKGSRKCTVCKKNGLKKETIYYCKTCAISPPLHPDVCFEVYHTQQDY